MNYIERMKQLKRKRIKASVQYAVMMNCEVVNEEQLKEDTILEMTYSDLIDIVELILDSYQLE
jgi:hypothetical protein